MKKRFLLVLFALSFVSLAHAGRGDTSGFQGYVNNFDRLDMERGWFMKNDGVLEELKSAHFVVQDLNRPTQDIVDTCNMPYSVPWTPENRLKYAEKHEHMFRVFVYANTQGEEENNLVAVFAVSPGRFGVHVEASGTRNFGSYTDEGVYYVKEHDSKILAGEKFGQAENGASIFDLYKSKASEGAPMFEAVFYKRGTAFHGSNGRVDGNPRSHACIRLRRDESPLLNKLARAVDANVKVTIRDTEVFKSCYDREYVRQKIKQENEYQNAINSFDKVDPAVRQLIQMGSGGLY